MAKIPAFVARINRNTKGLKAVSTGCCPDCETCRDEYAHDSTMAEYNALLESGRLIQDPFFSWQGCDLCGSTLGGNFEPWHAIDKNGDVMHGDRACVDCICYLANGDLPE